MRFIFFSIFLIGLMSCFNLQAQSFHGRKSYPIYKKGAKLVNDFDEAGVEIVRIEYDLVFSSKDTHRQLSSDWEYTILGFSDEGVKDLDVKVYEYDDLLEEWNLVAEDSSEEDTAEVSFTPEESGLFRVEVIVYEFNEGYSVARYGLIFVHD